MDLHLIPGAVASKDEREAIDAAIGSASPARHLLLPALHAAQASAGWVSPGALNHICTRLSVPPAEGFGVASFYAMFATKPRAPRTVHVCDDIACRIKGAEGVCRSLAQKFGAPGQDANGLNGVATWVRSPCLGLCEQAPAALVQRTGESRGDEAMAHVTFEDVVWAVESGDARPPQKTMVPQAESPRDPALRLLRRVGIADPESLDEYRAHGGYVALRKALSLGPERVLREVNDSKLLGRGGAAFPTGRKWEAVARNPARPHYLVCNADESEPGTFKDRVIMEEDPFALVEAMTIAGYATGCEQGYLYIRGEYPKATQRLQNAIGQARARGWLGDNIMGEGVRFDIELRRGAGAYICGEETSLFNSLEGLRGEPRNKPPFPVNAGLFGKPTVVNNVETFANVLDILAHGGPNFAASGTSSSSGTKLFCVSGCVARPGVYEAPFGISLRDVITLAGGVAQGRALRAVLLGGAAGVFVTPDELDMPLTFEGTRAAGATLGSGVIMLFDDRVDLGDILIRIAAFFRDESCGQCVPCRIGTIRQEEALHRLVAARTKGADAGAREVGLINDLAMVMRDASICGLGQTAASAVQSALLKFSVLSPEAH
ncbi:MAG: NADH-quinone oxidoreductase subunit E [Acidobacteria bacterium]|nr:NADH-quinone oxidoreductase subunit E [Acidobacteriota bacterium]